MAELYPVEDVFYLGRDEMIYSKLHSSLQCLLEAREDLQCIIPTSEEEGFVWAISMTSEIAIIDVAIKKNREALAMCGFLNPPTFN
jgi:hypothetical protein